MQISSNYKPRRNSLKSIEIPHVSYTFIVPIIRYESTMKYINLQEICKELNIYEFGVASWPLPENAKSILYESNPCPFTAANVEERLLGTSLFTPKSAIVCLFPYYVEHKDPSNLSRYTWATDYHLVINEYLKKAY